MKEISSGEEKDLGEKLLQFAYTDAGKSVRSCKIPAWKSVSNLRNSQSGRHSNLFLRSLFQEKLELKNKQSNMS